MKPNAIQVAIDILRELGREEEAWWIEHPEAVRELLRHAPTTATEQDIQCADCLAWPSQSHHRDCLVAAAWRALRDPRGTEDVAIAHDEALSMMAADAERRRREQQEAEEHRATIERIAALSDEEIIARIHPLQNNSSDSLYEFIDWGVTSGYWPKERAERLKANHPDVPAKNPRPRLRVLTATEIALRAQS